METHHHPYCIVDGDSQLGMRLHKQLTKKIGSLATGRRVGCGLWSGLQAVGREVGHRPALSKTRISAGILSLIPPQRTVKNVCTWTNYIKLLEFN